MIDERYMTAEGMKAAMEAQQRLPPFDLFASLGDGLGGLAGGSVSKPKQRQHYNGTVGVLTVARLENIIGAMKASGYDISLWIGKGWWRRPFVITAYAEDIKIVEANLLDS